MTHEELLALTNAIYPFAPDEDAEGNETESMYAEAMTTIAEALPNVYYAALEAAWASEDANRTVTDLLRRYGFIVYECVSEVANGIQCEFLGSGFNSLNYLDENELAEEAKAYDNDFAAMQEIWAAAHLDDGHGRHPQQNPNYVRLTQLLCDLTGEPEIDSGLTLAADPPTDRQCLGWLLTWAFGLTGNPYLDYIRLEIDNNQVELPAWDKVEIECALERMAEIAAVQPRMRRGWELYHQHPTAILATITARATKENSNAQWPI